MREAINVAETARPESAKDLSRVIIRALIDALARDGYEAVLVDGEEADK